MVKVVVVLLCFLTTQLARSEDFDPNDNLTEEEFEEFFHVDPADYPGEDRFAEYGRDMIMEDKKEADGHVSQEKLMKMVTKRQCWPNQTSCPAGCCPNANWFCCPDNVYCAATALDCPYY